MNHTRAIKDLFGQQFGEGCPRCLASGMAPPWNEKMDPLSSYLPYLSHVTTITLARMGQSHCMLQPFNKGPLMVLSGNLSGNV